jgi:hypothetical protein
MHQTMAAHAFSSSRIASSNSGFQHIQSAITCQATTTSNYNSTGDNYAAPPT